MSQEANKLPKLNGYEVTPGIYLMGEPTPVEGSDNLFRCLANYHGALALIQIKVTFALDKVLKAVPQQST